MDLLSEVILLHHIFIGALSINKFTATSQGFLHTINSGIQPEFILNRFRERLLFFQLF